MEGAIHVGDEPAADEEGAGVGNGDAAEPSGAGAVAAWHGRDAVPREVDEVEHLPLDLARAAVEGEREEPWGPETQRPAVGEEARPVGEQAAPAAAHQPARRVGGDGQAEDDAQRRVVREPRDEERLCVVVFLRGSGGGEAELGGERHLRVAELVDGGVVGGDTDAAHAPPPRDRSASAQLSRRGSRKNCVCVEEEAIQSIKE